MLGLVVTDLELDQGNDQVMITPHTTGQTTNPLGLGPREDHENAILAPQVILGSARPVIGPLIGIIAGLEVLRNALDRSPATTMVMNLIGVVHVTPA